MSAPKHGNKRQARAPAAIQVELISIGAQRGGIEPSGFARRATPGRGSLALSGCGLD
jgi:hypothetical protein